MLLIINNEIWNYIHNFLNRIFVIGSLFCWSQTAIEEDRKLVDMDVNDAVFKLLRQISLANVSRGRKRIQHVCKTLRKHNTFW